ncbi:hypothetical protein BCV70DRAFT_205318 [Testicularia cyperi]|uniref:Uncharacterized protein n=1 Tax=Testicularia cyperi TaxID=1882483 RepID=A0A317XUI3_9BASI|nr:hypothetical protein BCV70DRAFT_205318 [Testicularia cyperi]
MDADRVIPRKKPETSATFFVGTNSRVPRMTLAQSSHLIPMPMRSPTVRPPINRPLAQRKEMPRNQAVGEATGTHQQPALPRSTAPGGHGRVARAVEKFSQAEDETSLMADSSNLEGDQQAENTPCQSPPALHSELAELDDSRVVTMSLHHSDQPITRPVETVEPQSTHRSDTSSARPSPSQSAIVTRSVSAHPTTNPRLQDESTASGRAQHAPHSNRQSECSSSSAVSENGRISDLLFGCVTDLGPDPLHTLQQPLSARRNLASATALLAFPQLRKEEKDEGSLRDDGLDASDDVIEPDTQSTAAYGKVRGVASNRSASKAEVEDSAAHSVLEHEQASSPVLESTQPFLSPKIEVNAQELGKKAAKDTTSLDLRSESVPGDAVPAGGEDIFQMGMSAESRSLNRSMSATASSTDLPLATSAKASDRTLIETLPTWRQDARCAKQASTATLKTDNLIDVGFSEAVKEPRQAPSFTAVLSDPDLPELGTDTKLANIDCLQLTADCKTEFVRPVKAARHGVESDRGKDIASHAGTEISSGQRIKHEAAKRTQKAVVPPGRILLPDFKNNTSAERRTSSPHNPAPPGLVKERLRVNLPQAEYSSSFRADLIGLASHSDSRQRVKAFLDKLEQADDLVAEEHVVRRMQLRDLSADASAEVQQLFRPRMTLKELHTGTQVQRAQLKTGRLQMQQPFDEAVSSSQHSGSVPRRKNTPHWTTQNIAAAPEKKRAMPLPISGISPKSVGPDVLHRLQQSEPTAADEDPIDTDTVAVFRDSLWVGS